MIKNDRQRYDWAAVERDYRTGQYSNRELSRRHGPSEAAIRKRAADGSWARDLSEQIRQRVREKTCRAVAQELVNAESDAEVVELAAEAGAEVIRGHQRLLLKARELTEMLMGRLHAQLMSCVAEPAGLAAAPVLVAGDRVRVWVEGGADGAVYKITVKVLTAGGEIFEDELTCRVRDV